MTAPRRELLQRVGAAAILVVFAVVLMALIPVGQATWIEMLTVSGDVATNWTDPPAPAQVSISGVATSCDPEPSLVVSVLNSGEAAGGEVVLEAWIAPGTDEAALAGTTTATSPGPGATGQIHVSAVPGATHLVALFHGSADTVWSEPVEFPPDACAASAGAEPVTTTTAASTSTTSTTEATTTTTEASTTTSSTSTTTTEPTSTTTEPTSTTTSSSTTTTTEPTSTTTSSSTTTTTEPTSTTTTSSSTTTSSTTTSTTTTTLPG